MDAIPYSTFRADLANSMDRVNDDQKPLLVTRQNGKSAILMSVDEYKALEETAYLLSSPRNAARLAEAIEDVKAGKTNAHDLSEE